MEEPVTIVDRNVLKVLSVDTRMDILKILSDGSRTPSDLSKRLKKSGATIVEHLEVLCKVGLVKKIEQPGKKWIFYTLTERGYGIIASKSRKLVIILGTSLISGMFGLVGLGAHMMQSFYGAMSSAPEAMTKIASPAVATPATAPAIAIQVPWLLYLSIALMTISFVGIGFYFYQKSRVTG